MADDAAERGDDSAPPSIRSRELLAVEHVAADASEVPALMVGAGSKKPASRATAAPPTKPSFAPPPPSALLSRLQDFLPQMAAANDDLAEAMRHRPAEEFDVEHVGEDADARRVEMDVGLGVVDLKTREAADAVAKSCGVAVVGAEPDADASGDASAFAKRRKQVADAREDATIRIPGLDADAAPGKRAGIEEL
jgi:hypothetical protein